MGLIRYESEMENSELHFFWKANKTCWTVNNSPEDDEKDSEINTCVIGPEAGK